jgi:hypothetical protein
MLTFTDAMDQKAICHVFIDRKREGIRSLKDHSYFFSEVYDIELADRRARDKDASVNPDTPYQVIHPVEAPQKGRFTAAGWANQGSDGIFVYGNIDVFQSMKAAVKEVQLLSRKGKIITQGCWQTSHYPNFP